MYYCEKCNNKLFCYDPGYEKSFFKCNKCDLYYVAIKNIKSNQYTLKPDNLPKSKKEQTHE